MRARARRSLLLAALAVIVGLVQACDDPPDPPVIVMPPEPVRAVIATTGFDQFAPDIWVAIPLQLTQAGRLDITVDWTFQSSWIYVYFGDQVCTYEQLAARTCPFLVRSETQEPKPRVLLHDISQAGTFFLVLYNVPLDRRTGVGSDNIEAIFLQLGLTVGLGRSDGGAVKVGQPIVIRSPRL